MMIKKYDKHEVSCYPQNAIFVLLDDHIAEITRLNEKLNANFEEATEVIHNEAAKRILLEEKIVKLRKQVLYWQNVCSEGEDQLPEKEN